MYVLYGLALGLALVVSAPWWLWQMLRHHKYRDRLGERLGRVPRRLLGGSPPAAGCIWVHAVSVGEVLAVSGLIGELRRRFPERRVLVSTTTLTGQKLAAGRLGEENVFYVPLDFAFAVRAYMRALRPELVVLAETEFWPNFLRLARQSGARVAVVNARISDRSLPGYLRWRNLLARVLRNVDVFLAQSEEDARRLVKIGAQHERVRVSGNLKFDAQPAREQSPQTQAAVERLREQMRNEGVTTVLVCGSTVHPEEDLCLNAFSGLVKRSPRSMMIVAPRHPERFVEVADVFKHWPFTWWRRSELRGDEPLAGGVLLLDTIGELAAFYELATVAFVGGSLAPRGGHNILEPARLGIPVIVGPYTENFRDIIQAFTRAQAIRVVTDDTFPSEVTELMLDRNAREKLGLRAVEVVRAQSGVLAKTADPLGELLLAPAETRESLWAEKAAR